MGIGAECVYRCTESKKKSKIEMNAVAMNAVAMNAVAMNAGIIKMVFPMTYPVLLHLSLSLPSAVCPCLERCGRVVWVELSILLCDDCCGLLLMLGA